MAGRPRTVLKHVNTLLSALFEIDERLNELSPKRSRKGDTEELDLDDWEPVTELECAWKRTLNAVCEALDALEWVEIHLARKVEHNKRRLRPLLANQINGDDERADSVDCG
jgi:hypothetical protein